MLILNIYCKQFQLSWLFQEMDSSNDESDDERRNATIWRRRGGRRKAYDRPNSPEHERPSGNISLYYIVILQCVTCMTQMKGGSRNVGICELSGVKFLK